MIATAESKFGLVNYSRCGISPHETLKTKPPQRSVLVASVTETGVDDDPSDLLCRRSGGSYVFRRPDAQQSCRGGRGIRQGRGVEWNRARCSFSPSPPLASLAPLLALLAGAGPRTVSSSLAMALGRALRLALSIGTDGPVSRLLTLLTGKFRQQVQRQHWDGRTLPPSHGVFLPHCRLDHRQHRPILLHRPPECLV